MKQGKERLGGSVLGSAGKGCSHWAALRLLGAINSFISHGSNVLSYTERAVREILPQCPPCCATRCASARSGNHNQLRAQKMGIKPHCFNCCLHNGGIWCSHLQAAPLLWQCCTTPSVQVGESRGSSFFVPQPQEQEEA